MKTIEEALQNKDFAILEAAEKEFLAKGFDGARTTSIAAAAGVTHAMLHYYFRSKEMIFECVLKEKIRLMGESVLQAFGNPGLPLFERLKEGVSRHFDFLIVNPDLPRFIVNEVASKPERYEMMRKQVEPIVTVLAGNMQTELDASAERGETEWVDVRQLMISILSLNIFSFIAYPVIRPLVETIGDRETFLEARRRENIEIIIRRLRKS